ncbi:hypothetical protein FRC01_014382 [Tulasnella sp. 417]|nr:hypothetical protein FRC01_014382 [Tulasnella sp. 417]
MALWHFFITQGVIPGLANGLMFPMSLTRPQIISYPSMWFKKKRALASGIVVAGSSFGGGASSLIVRALLTRLGLRNTLLVYAGIYAVFLTVAFFLLKSRGPARHVVKIEWVDRTAFNDLVFWSLALCILFTDFGYLSPFVFLTTYTSEKIPNISAQMSVAPTAVMNFSSGIGRTVVGLTADRIGVTNAFIGSIFISATAQLVLWNLAESYAVIVVFSVVVGAFGGCFIRYKKDKPCSSSVTSSSPPTPPPFLPMKKEPVDLPPAYPASRPDSRHSSTTFHGFTGGGDVEKVEEAEIVPPGSDKDVVGVLPNSKDSPLEEEEFPEGGRGCGYKPFIGIGSVIAVIGFLTAAFSTQLWHFFITQGVIPGIGSGLMLPMLVSYPAMWFKKKRGLASGIVVAGSSFGGGVSSLIVRALLTRLGLRNTLLVYAGANAVLLTLAFFLLKSRGPARRVAKIEWVDRTAFSDLVFWSLALCMLFTDFGYLSPVVFITTYTNEKVSNISPQMSVAPTAVMNFSSAVGRTAVGLAADRIGVTNAFIGSIVLSAIAQLVLWNLAESYAVIMVFSVVEGAFGGCFISHRPAIWNKETGYFDRALVHV